MSIGTYSLNQIVTPKMDTLLDGVTLSDEAVPIVEQKVIVKFESTISDVQQTTNFK